MKAYKLIIAVYCAAFCLSSQATPVHMGSGIKTGEVTSSTAVVWTRLTTVPNSHKGGIDPKTIKRTDTDPKKLATVNGAMPGADGEVKISWWPDNDKNKTLSSEWTAVDPLSDYTYQFKLKNLQPNTRYLVKAEGRSASEIEVTVDGAFHTAEIAEKPQKVLFTVITGQAHFRRDDKVRGHKIYPSMQKLNPHFMVHTGDVVYYDKPGPLAQNPAVARLNWNMVYALEYQRDFHNNVSSYFMKDDHDVTQNDSYPGLAYGDISWETGLKIFKEQTPDPGTPYRTIRWGKDLQIWLVEGREFRSKNDLPDGPEKTIWGKEQLEWFKRTVQESDASFKVLVSPLPIVGPDRANKSDNHANAGFTYEGDLIREFIGKQKDMYVVCGDRHWQYVTVDPKSGVREYSCGPTSDKHASGFKMKYKTPMHKYLNIKGGFLSVLVERKNDKPTILFRHHDIKGTIYNDEFWSTTK